MSLFFPDGYLLEALRAAITGVNCCVINGADVAATTSCAVRVFGEMVALQA